MSIRGLTRVFGSVVALQEVTFQIPAGALFGVLGPNGAGKTTLFSVMSGFLAPTEGAVEVLGTSHPEEVHGRMSILPQDAQFQPNIPIVDQLEFFLRLTGYGPVAARKEMNRVLAMVGLEDLPHRQAATLSHGMYKRLSLAQAFLGQPELIILDEPTSGLDWRTAEKVRRVIQDLHEGATILVSSHNMAEMEQLCDHVAVLNHGSLVAAGPVAEVTGLSRAYTLGLSRALGAEELESCRGIPGVGEISPAEGALEYRLAFSSELADSEVDDVLRAVLGAILSAGIAPRRIREENRLEELYASVTSHPTS